MHKLRQQLVRRARLLLTVCMLALASAPAVALADAVQRAHVVQIATARAGANEAIAAPSVASRAAVQRAAATCCEAAPAVVRAAARAAHGPSFDGRSLYLVLSVLLR